MEYTFKEVSRIWLKSKTNIKRQSVLNYENMMKTYLDKKIGATIISSLVKDMVEEFFEELCERRVAISTQKKLMYIIKATIDYAYDKEYLHNYPNLKSIKFKTVQKSIIILTKSQQTALENMLTTNLNVRKVCLLLCLYTGLRVGEVSGLKWEDIDFGNNSLTIKRTIERIRNTNENIPTKTVLIASSPKSDKSSRTIPFPSFLVTYLQTFRGADKDYILSGCEKKYDPRLFQSFYHRTLKACGIERNKFHTTRHTFSTRAIESKMDIKTLSELLGHSSIEITLKLYVHPSYELKKSSIENLVTFMSNI